MPNLQWHGKDAAKSMFERTPVGLFHSAESSFPSVAAANEHLLIQGDNLAAMKALMSVHEGQVKLAYLDPPSNAPGRPWRFTSPVYDDITAEWAEMLVRSDDLMSTDMWATMIFPRLMAARALLRPDGIVAVSAKEDEMHVLPPILEEVFGPSSHLATIRRTNASARSLPGASTRAPDRYVMLYAKDATAVAPLGLAAPDITIADGDIDDAIGARYRHVGADAGSGTADEVSFIAGVIGMATRPGDLILDAFAGAGAAGVATVAVNAAERALTGRGSRHVIMCEQDPTTEETITRVHMQRAVDQLGDTRSARGARPDGRLLRMSIPGPGATSQ